MLTLHHLNQSRSFRILWLLCELNALYGTPFRVIKHNRTKSHLAPRQLTEIHPMGKAPILVDETHGRTLAESGFIIEYLLRYYDTDGKLSPADETWEDYTFWLHFAESSLMPNLVMRLVFSKIVQKSPFFIRPIIRGVQKGVENSFISPNVDKALTLLNKHLANRHYLSGTGQGVFGAVDIHLHFGIAQMKKSGGLSDKWVHVHNWLAYCESRPSFEMAQSYE
ncbi:glutathione S-transferase [Moraxella equi]|uniref:Glutathione S-transferase, N-terminal domain n=1 Tax=Moraxella equi TaxID=60442 RepID=A0A378QND8_9GAMM|nr:glutathione S-transferase [Moraxella equi]OPH38581.1 hypothetical protein B5J93_05890 [Moraxella equi]STZ02416.1 Glutathione S-transferase, N-terminal domain [Moraxella equi]